MNAACTCLTETIGITETVPSETKDAKPVTCYQELPRNKLGSLLQTYSVPANNSTENPEPDNQAKPAVQVHVLNRELPDSTEKLLKSSSVAKGESHIQPETEHKQQDKGCQSPVMPYVSQPSSCRHVLKSGCSLIAYVDENSHEINRDCMSINDLQTECVACSHSTQWGKNQPQHNYLHATAALSASKVLHTSNLSVTTKKGWSKYDSIPLNPGTVREEEKRRFQDQYLAHKRAFSEQERLKVRQEKHRIDHRKNVKRYSLHM